MRLRTLAVALALAGCNQYEYRPEENATAQIGGRIAAAYPIPPEKPEGTVRVAGWGVDRQQKLLHLRMVVENNSLTDAWSIDPNQLHVELSGRAVSPSRVAGSTPDLPSVQVPPGGKRTLDLFFPLPDEMARASKLPAFDFVWRVQTGGRTVAERTPFERMSSVYYYSYELYGAYGPYWAWGGPAWIF
jgi:hypothetical protein